MAGMARIRPCGRVRTPDPARRSRRGRLLLCCVATTMNAVHTKLGTPWRSWLALLGLGLGLWGAAAIADGLDGRFEVRSADLELKDGVFHLNARLDLPVTDAVREGLSQGVPLGLELDLSIDRVRQMLPNSGVAELTQRYHLQYNAVSGHYILRNDNSGQQESLPTLDAALEQLSQVRGVPVLDRSLISPA